MKNKNAFTLLELLIVITLLLLIFGIIGYTYVSNIKGLSYLSIKSQKTVQEISLVSQITKQIFSSIEKKTINFELEEDRISFYTLYPIFYEGAVRAEYRIEKVKDKYKVLYMEFPYIDGKLGDEGLKKTVIGYFDYIKVEVLQNGRFLRNFRSKGFPQYLIIFTKNRKYLISKK
ncbi:MAG TPA: prepilin-type N-terminal cleavage/methylation domain-containing protein [Persephonella sp.]|nr:prepilin-type N-terminal cleavage/methylation domain-containing protein [Hydrogenothermaceae bacterium]HIQ24758.1 prepilin-type N-terminal cleavage/methylation domain-containing protein [Persephonella sp.]